MIPIFEALSKQQIIKHLKGNDFPVENILSEFEKLYSEEATKNSKLDNNVEYVPTYVLKILSVLKKGGKKELEYPQLARIIYLMSLVNKKKYISSLPFEISSKINKLMSIQTIQELENWIVSFPVKNLEDELEVMQIKSWIKPIMEFPNNIKIYEIKNHSEARVLGADTKWCISGSTEGEYHCNKYTKYGVQYALLINSKNFKDGEKFALTLPQPNVWKDLKETAKKTLDEYLDIIDTTDVTENTIAEFENLMEEETNYYQKYRKEIEALDPKACCINVFSFGSEMVNKMDFDSILFDAAKKLRPVAYKTNLNLMEKDDDIVNCMLEIVHDYGDYLFNRLLKENNNVDKFTPNIKDYTENEIEWMIKENKFYVRVCLNITPESYYDNYVKAIELSNILKLKSKSEYEARVRGNLNDYDRVILEMPIDTTKIDKYNLYPLFEFADKENDHVSFIPFLKYFLPISKTKEQAIFFAEAQENALKFSSPSNIVYSIIYTMLPVKFQKSSIIDANTFNKFQEQKTTLIQSLIDLYIVIMDKLEKSKDIKLSFSESFPFLEYMLKEASSSHFLLERNNIFDILNETLPGVSPKGKLVKDLINKINENRRIRY